MIFKDKPKEKGGRIMYKNYNQNHPVTAKRDDVPFIAHIYVEIEDYINEKWSVEVVRRIVECWRKYDIRGELLMNALNAEVIQRNDPDLIKLINKMNLPIIPLAHIHKKFDPQLMEKINKMQWDQAVNAYTKWFTQYVDKQSGELDPNRSGWWKRIEEIFGRKPSLDQRGGRGFLTGASRNAFGYALRLIAGSWQEEWQNIIDGTILTFRPTDYLQRWGGFRFWDQPSGAFEKEKVEETIKLPQPVERLKFWLKMAPKNKINLIDVHAHEFNFYLYPRILKHLASNPKLYRTGTEPGPLIPKEIQEQAWHNYEELMAYISKRPEIECLTTQDIIDKYYKPVEYEFDLNREEIIAIARDLYYRWRHTRPTVHPPSFVNIGHRYLSLTEAFQALVVALLQYKRKGHLPGKVHINDIFGPIDTPPELGMRYERSQYFISKEEVMDAVEKIANSLNDKIPGKIPVGKRMLNASEFLWLMVQGILLIVDYGQTGKVLWTACSVCAEPDSIWLDTVVKEYCKNKGSWQVLLNEWKRKPLIPNKLGKKYHRFECKWMA